MNFWINSEPSELLRLSADHLFLYCPDHSLSRSTISLFSQNSLFPTHHHSLTQSQLHSIPWKTLLWLSHIHFRQFQSIITFHHPVSSFSRKLSRYQNGEILLSLNVITSWNLYMFIRSLQVWHGLESFFAKLLLHYIADYYVY